MTIIKRNNVNIIGEGQQAIICAHGFGCEQSMWQYISPSFTEKYKLILFDYVGAGASDITAYDFEKYSTLDGYKQDILDIIDELQLEKTIFFGHSISSMVVMLAAIERPEAFEKIVMIGPSPCYLNKEDFQGGFEESDIRELLEMMEINFSGWASYMAPTSMGSEASQHLTDEMEETFVSTNPRIAREFAEVTFFSDYRHRLHELHTPTLIMQCVEDSIVPLHVSQYLHDNLEQSEMRVINGKGHCPHISHPIETVKIIKEFLES